MSDKVKYICEISPFRVYLDTERGFFYAKNPNRAIPLFLDAGGYHGSIKYHFGTFNEVKRAAATWRAIHVAEKYEAPKWPSGAEITPGSEEDLPCGVWALVVGEPHCHPPYFRLAASASWLSIQEIRQAGVELQELADHLETVFRQAGGK